MNDKERNKKVEIIFIKLKKSDVQFFIQFIKDHFKNDSIIDQKYKILHEEKNILIPLVKNQEMIDRLIKAIDNLISFEIISKEGFLNPNFKYKSLQEALAGKIPANYLHLIPKSYDIIGNIAILEFKKQNQIVNSEFNGYKDLIAKAVLDVNKNVLSVFEKKSEIKGSHRLRDLAYLTGENNTETIHKENGCFFKLDIKTTYFSPRLGYERRRIIKNNMQENEMIVDMFSGVGPFSIQIAKQNPVKVHAFDLNPDAYRFLKTNIDLNKLKGTVIPYNMNIKDLINPSNQVGDKLHNNVDRVIMNLPEKSIDFIDVACFLMKKLGGILHFYQFSEKPNAIDKTIGTLKKKLNEFNWTADKKVDSKIVKSYSPKAELVVVDLNMKCLNS